MAGNIPIKDDIILTRGADFIARYAVTPGKPDIPPGSTARIEITETNDTDAPIITTWTATSVDARYIEFRVESEDTDLVENRTRYRPRTQETDRPRPPARRARSW